jgi:hypothetical protein
MLIKDRIYGNFSIDDPVILELLKSRPMLRLKGISQFGVPDKYHYIKGFSRYEHSVGVMILLRKLGASLEEQGAGLLHDVSHTAFSHVVDWVLGQGKTENFQDDAHFDFVSGPEVGRILKKYGYSPNRISNLRSYKLLDREIPDLCADRVDYAIRQCSSGVVKDTAKDLTIFNGKIVFRTKSSALSFAENFLLLQTSEWAGFEGSSRYKAFSDVLKRAIDLRLIGIKDFFGDEQSILKTIEKSDDSEIKYGLAFLRKRSLIGLPLDTDRVYKKFRYVDPEFINKGKLQRVSKAYPKFERKLKEAMRENKKGLLVASVGFPL